MAGFAHLTGRAMWARCDHAGTRIEGTPGAVVLAPADAGARPGAGSGAAADLAAWRAALGSAVVLPSPPDQCAGTRVLAAGGGRAPALLGDAGWHDLPAPVSAPTAPAAPGEFVPLAPAAGPAAPTFSAVARDPWGRLWLLDRPGRRLWLLAPDLTVQAMVPVPADFDPALFGCTARGLVVTDAATPRLAVAPWGGAWQGYAFPRAGAAADAGVALVALAADPAWPRAVVLARGGSGARLLLIDADGVTRWPLPLVREPLHLLLTGPDRLLVADLPAAGQVPGDPRPVIFHAIRLGPDGPEAEGAFAVRGFDGRALWRGDDAVLASTAAGARPLYPREPALAGRGRVETFALDSGIFACVWHRLFLDLCLPADCAVTVQARTADDLPPRAVARGPRPPADRLPPPGAGVAPEPPPPAADDPWPMLGSLTPEDNSGWVPLGIADRRPWQVDRPLGAGSGTGAGVGGRDRGTHEWLITAPPGRYLWLRIDLTGTARRGPALFAARATFPRPSLLDYLPAYWRADPAAGDATDRALALFEGFSSELEQRIEALPRLCDPRLVPAAALDWLADFLALAFDGRLDEGVRRQLLREIAGLYRARGTVPGLTRLLSILAGAPVQIIEGFRLRRPGAALVGADTQPAAGATVGAVLGPGLELGGREVGLLPVDEEPWVTRLALAHGALLARRADDPTPCPAAPPPDPLPEDGVQAYYRRHAHRFTVVVPRPCEPDLAAVLELALARHKPAHTLHRVCWLDAGWRLDQGLVGVARLGPVARPAPAILGEAVLSPFATIGRGRADDRWPLFQPLDPAGTAP